MSIVKRFITESMKRTEIDEFLQKKLERAGYGGVNLSKTPLGTHVVIYAMRPGLVIGRGGETIKELASALEQNFKVSNPQISVSEIEVPEFNAHVVANRVASALERGVHFRRAGFWALNQVMEAGAFGAEIVISGKLTTETSTLRKIQSRPLPNSRRTSIKSHENSRCPHPTKTRHHRRTSKNHASRRILPRQSNNHGASSRRRTSNRSTTSPAPHQHQLKPKPEPEPEPEVQAKEVADEPKPEETKE